MNFRRCIIVAELWLPKVARRCKKSFSAFLEKGALTEKKSKFCSERIHRVKFGRREIGRPKLVRYLPSKKQNFAWLSSSAAARLAPKICHGQPQTMYSHRFTFVGVIPERVNTARAREKVESNIRLNPSFETNNYIVC